MERPNKMGPFARLPILSLLLLCTITLNSPAQAAKTTAPVAVAEAQQQPIIREAQLTGTVTSPRRAMLSAQVSGVVEELLVEVGERVEQGQALLKLDRELAAHTLEQLRAQVRRAEADLAEARRQVKEGERLASREHIPESELERRRSAVQTAEASLAASRAEARHQTSLVERHTLRAPFGGVISKRTTELGEWVSPGSPVLELVANEALRFDFRVSQELYPHIDRNSRVTLTLDAMPERSFDGRIHAIVPINESDSRTFLLRVTAQDSHPAVIPGMSVQARLAIDTGREGVVVPRDAVLRHPDGRITVWQLLRDGDQATVKERQVTPGLLFGQRLEIRSGLAAGATVVVEGNEALQDGQAVHVTGN